MSEKSTNRGFFKFFLKDLTPPELSQWITDNAELIRRRNCWGVLIVGLCLLFWCFMIFAGFTREWVTQELESEWRAVQVVLEFFRISLWALTASICCLIYFFSAKKYRNNYLYLFIFIPIQVVCFLGWQHYKVADFGHALGHYLAPRFCSGLLNDVRGYLIIFPILSAMFMVLTCDGKKEKQPNDKSPKDKLVPYNLKCPNCGQRLDRFLFIFGQNKCCKCSEEFGIKLKTVIIAGLILVVPLLILLYMMLNKKLHPAPAIMFMGFFVIWVFILFPYIIKFKPRKNDEEKPTS